MEMYPSLNYAINEGFKSSWKGALIGGAAGSVFGSVIAEEELKQNPKADLMVNIIFIVLPLLGVVSGTAGGFIVGAAKGGLTWAIYGPLEPHSADDKSILLGASLTNHVVQWMFNSKEY
jgi:hypothetical protein